MFLLLFHGDITPEAFSLTTHAHCALIIRSFPTQIVPTRQISAPFADHMRQACPLSSLCGSFCAILSAPLCWLGFWDLLWSQSEGYRTTGETVKGCACSKGNGSWQHGLVCQWPTKWLILKNTEIKAVNARGSERECRHRTWMILLVQYKTKTDLLMFVKYGAVFVLTLTKEQVEF